jgi:drug/metabolite transporter (DMT)-like permease
MFQSTALLAILFVFLWNSGFIVAEYVMPNAGPYTQLFWRYSTLALILLSYLVINNRYRWPGWSTAAPTFLVGILAHGVWLSCCLLSIQHDVPAGIVALIVALQPLATGALSGIVVGESTPKLRWVGLIVGFGGVVLTILARVDFKDSTSLIAYFLPLGAVVAMTTATLLQRKLELNRRSYILPLALTLFYQCLATALVLIIPATLIEGLAVHWQPGFLGGMVWLIFAVSLCAYALLFALIKRIDATRVASLFYLGPPITMLMAWAAFGDSVQTLDGVGMAIVCIGVVLTYLQTEDQAKQKNKLS